MAEGKSRSWPGDWMRTEHGERAACLTPHADDLEKLFASPWHGHVTLSFDGTTAVHPGIFDAVETMLDRRPHFCHTEGERLFVSMTLAGGDPADLRLLGLFADEVQALAPNASIVETRVTRDEATDLATRVGAPALRLLVSRDH